MTSAYEPWNEERGAEIIAEHNKLEGATLVILHAMQEAFGYVPEPAIPMIAAALSLSRGLEPGQILAAEARFRRQLLLRQATCLPERAQSQRQPCNRSHCDL